MVGIVKVLLINHIIPALAGSLLTLMLVLLVLRLFFIKRPAIRHAFLLIPLIKPLLMLIGGIQIKTGPWLGLQMPDPLNLINPAPDSWVINNLSRFSIHEHAGPESTRLFLAVAAAVTIAIMGLFAYQWVALLTYRMRLVKEEEIGYELYKDIVEMNKGLSVKAKIRTPRLILADVPSPAVVGILNTAIILPGEIMKELSRDEIGAILAHEIAHIKRKDNIWLWVDTICRDVMFYNPVARFIFKQRLAEREKAADYLAARLTKKPVELASSLVKIAEKMVLRDVGLAWSMRSMFVAKTDLEKRVKNLLGFRAYDRLIIRKALLVLLFVWLLYARLTVNLQIPYIDSLFFFG